MYQQAAFGYDVPWDDRKSLVTTGEQFEAMMRQVQAAKVRIFDHETSGLAWYKHAASCGLGIGCFDSAGVRSWYVPYRHLTHEAQLDLALVSPAIRRLFGEPDVLWVAHHFKFDEHFNNKEGWTINGRRYCTQMAARLYNENLPIGLKKRAQTDLGLSWAGHWEKQLDVEIARLAKSRQMKKREYLDQFGYAETPIDLCGFYGCYDIDFTGQLYALYERASISTNYARIWNNEMELIEALGQMEETGMPVDVPYLERLRGELTQVTGKLHAELAEMLQWAMFSLGSDAELRSFLYERLRIPVTRKTKGGLPSVENEVLVDAIQHHPAIPLILEWREAEKIRTTWTDSILKKLDSNHILHGQLQNDGTNTGRLSSSQPNLQNFQSDSDDRAIRLSGRKVEDGGTDPWSVRRAFTMRRAADGRLMPRLYFDYSQIELRVMAHYTQDPIMVDTYLKGGDIHERTQREVGSLLGGEPIARRPAKVINFGLCIAGGQRVLTQQDGYVPIERVAPWHLLWDGVKWVSHGGLVCRGECEVVSYGGVTATPDHKVFTTDGRKVSIGDLASEVCDGHLAIGEVGGHPVGYSAYDRQNGDPWLSESEVRRGSLFGVPEDEVAVELERGGGQEYQLHVPAGEVSRPEGEDVGAALRRYGPAMPERHARLVAEIQGAGNQSVVSVTGEVYSLGPDGLSEYGFQGVGFRQDRQRRALRGEQSSIGESVGESQKQVTQVYDLINAGPRHRFTVEGRVVSNSYCMSPMGLSRNAGIPVDQAEQFLDAFFVRYHGVKTYRDVFWTKVTFQNCEFTNMFGRPRRVPGLASPRDWERRRAERQAFGTLIQGTAAQLTKEAIVRIYRWLQQCGYEVYLVSTVHDEIWLDVHPSCLVEVVQTVKRLMQDFSEFAPIPIIVDGKYSTTNWAEKISLPA